jgi:adenylate kinase
MNILFIGKPASGKGSITQRIIDENFVQLSTGDLLRAEQEKGTELGNEIKALLSQGKFATDETIFNLVEKFLLENSDKSIIFDGFPRNVAQAKHCLERGINFDYVFNIEVPDETVKQRIVNRRVHPQSGRVYNIVSLPPKVEGIDDITGEPLVQRNDDRIEVVAQRLENFNTLTYPIIEFLQKEGLIPIKDQVDMVKETLSSEVKNKRKLKV